MTKTEQLLGGFWFLRSLLFASIIYAIWQKFVFLLGNNQLMLIIGIVLCLTISFLLTFYNINIRYFNSVNFLSTAFFMTGIFFSQVKMAMKLQKIIIIVSILLLGSSVLQMPCNILKINAVQIIPYFIVATTISYSKKVICFYAKPSKYINWLATVGGRTMDVLIFHFLALKIASLIKCWCYDMPLTLLSEFPVITENNDYYWMLYSILGVALSLMIATIINKFQCQFFNKLNYMIEK